MAQVSGEGFEGGHRIKLVRGQVVSVIDCYYENSGSTPAEFLLFLVKC